MEQRHEPRELSLLRQGTTEKPGHRGPHEARRLERIRADENLLVRSAESRAGAPRRLNPKEKGAQPAAPLLSVLDPRQSVIVRGAFEERAEFARARRMPQLAQSLRLDLPNTLAGDGERLPHFLERVFAAVVEAEAHLDHFFLARRERLQHRRRLFLEAQVD